MGQQAMDAEDLQAGFHIGDRFVEPRAFRVNGAGTSHALTTPQLEILLCLVEHHGEAVDRRLLRARAWPGARTTDAELREAGLDWKARKGRVDALAAQHILQDYFDAA